MATTVPSAGTDLTVIGWMESIDLPELDLNGVKSKIDTGARTTALHATRIEHFQRDGKEWVRFRTLAGALDADHMRTIEARVASMRWIKNTSGIPEERIVIRSKAKFGNRLWTIDLSLADRSNMTFPMIIGRSALKNHAVAVHTKRAYLISDNPHKQSRKDT
ncbi:ATP-dependent zinc protease [Pseudoruegeria sp. SHC-113]|uniref:ATP-dependent zinc protease family protein n=1 Tax=Pseudoruegeria sp. SHC-113 TaxID=2855439 RepID=UPI0021BA80AD|nr:RimK/LysX family protein [Pseudoruegeria sp. SHC-113]MCT8161922.1 RimK/LysX family protein [Pseudoruegeria sp. SHC-113]